MAMDLDYNKPKNAPMEKFSKSPGGSVESGLASQEKITDTPEQLGQGRKGKKANQVPYGPDKRTAKGPFKFA